MSLGDPGRIKLGPDVGGGGCVTHECTELKTSIQLMRGVQHDVNRAEQWKIGATVSISASDHPCVLDGDNNRGRSALSEEMLRY